MKDDIKDLLLNNIDSRDEIADSGELYDHLDYAGGLHEIIGSNIDVYCYDLRKWAVDNYDWIDEAIGSGIAGGDDDFHKLIQGGQYMALNQDAVEIVEELFNEYSGKLFNVEQVA
jgi:hypothetical protein